MLIIVLDKTVTELYMYVKKKEIINNIWLNYMYIFCFNRFELEQAHNEEIQKIEEKRYCHHYESKINNFVNSKGLWVKRFIISYYTIVCCCIRLHINIMEKKYSKAEEERQSKQSQLERELEEKQYELQRLEISLQKVHTFTPLKFLSYLLLSYMYSVYNMYIYFNQSYCLQILEILYMYYSTSFNFAVVTIIPWSYTYFWLLIISCFQWYFLVDMQFSGCHCIFWLSHVPLPGFLSNFNCHIISDSGNRRSLSLLVLVSLGWMQKPCLNFPYFHFIYRWSIFFCY